MLRALLVVCAVLSLTAAAPGVRPKALSARDIVVHVVEAAGGETWRRPDTLYLGGYGVFWPDGTQASEVVNEQHEMWRIFPRAHPDAHVANGQVRIDSWRDGRLVFQMGFDGAQGWTHQGLLPGGADNPEFRENFGFGIIRFALDPGYRLTRLPDDAVEGRAAFLIQVEDPAGGKTLFGIDRSNFHILKVGFQTPRGWHERTYSDFKTLSNPRWVQPMRLKLFYNGVKQNEIVWTRAVVNRPIDPALFTPPATPATPQAGP
jgi:hypothetical protein